MNENTDNTTIKPGITIDGLDFEQTGICEFTLKVRQACNATDYTISMRAFSLRWALFARRVNQKGEFEGEAKVLSEGTQLAELIPALRADDLQQVAEIFGLDNPEEEIKEYYEDFFTMTLNGSNSSRESNDGCVADCWIGPWVYSRLASQVQEEALGYGSDDEDDCDISGCEGQRPELDENNNLENEETDDEL